MISRAFIGASAVRTIIPSGGTPTYTPVTFGVISPAGADFTYTPGRAAEQWHNDNAVNIPVEGTNTPRTDYYRRWRWTDFENITQGTYSWTEFDNAMHEAINANQKFSFGIMTVCDGCSTVTVSGAEIGYPTYVHTLMQGEGNPDWRTNGTGPSPTGGVWVPNWNSNNFLTRFEALLNAIANRIATISYTATSGPLVGQSIPYSKVIQYIDIRGYGQYGEWHQVNIVTQSSNYPANTRPTLVTLKRIVDAHKNAFSNYPLVCLIAIYEGGFTFFGNIDNPPDIAEYALTQSNSWGKYGWRKDSYGDSGAYLRTILENNPGNQNGVDFNTEIMNRYKLAPIVGEPVFGGTYTTMPSDVNLYHNSSFGNGNYGVTLTTAIKNAVRSASKSAGYRINVPSGIMPSVIPQNSSFDITLDWQNVGLSPCYESWDVKFQLRSGSTVFWSGTSTKQLKLFLPSASTSQTIDTFSFGPSVPVGTYNLYVIITDTVGYRSQPFPLAINGRNVDGSYTLLTGVQVVAPA